MAEGCFWMSSFRNEILLGDVQRRADKSWLWMSSILVGVVHGRLVTLKCFIRVSLAVLSGVGVHLGETEHWRLGLDLFKVMIQDIVLLTWILTIELFFRA
jgi:hypothetical protein